MKRRLTSVNAGGKCLGDLVSDVRRDRPVGRGGQPRLVGRATGERRALAESAPMAVARADQPILDESDSSNHLAILNVHPDVRTPTGPLAPINQN